MGEAVHIRQIGPDDLPFLKDMLYAAVAWRPRPPKELAIAVVDGFRGRGVGRRLPDPHGP